MKYQMPEPFRKQGQQLCNDGNTTVFFDAYTASQVQAAYEAGRAAGLEAAAEAIDDECRERIMTASDCIDAIRNLKETPCA